LEEKEKILEKFSIKSDNKKNEYNFTNKDSRNEDKKEQRKENFFGMLFSTLFSGLLVSLIIYYNTKEDNHNNWCTQEVKKFDYNKYGKKDLSILLNECKEHVVKYEMLEDTLSNTKNINKFSSIINQLYVDNKIDNSFITNFSDKEIINKLNNSSYNFNNIWTNKKNNLPILDAEINKYLQFTKEVLFKKYEDDQITNYFNLFIYLFQKDNFFHSNSVPSYYYGLEEKRDIDFKVNQKLKDLISISENSGKIYKKKITVSSKDEFIMALSKLFNSYNHKDNKDELILLLTQMTNNIRKNREMLNKSPQGQIINNIFYSEKILQLVWYELYTYTLEKSDLEKIFIEYLKINQYVDVFHTEISYKLLYNLFNTNFSSNEKLFHELFITNYLNKRISLNKNLINYLAMKEQIPLLLEIFELKNTTRDLKREIFIAILIGQKHNPHNFDYETILIDLTDNEKDVELQKIMILDLLSFNNVKVVEYSIDFIKKNEAYYLSKLNNYKYYGFSSYYQSIFGLLANNKPSWIAKQKEIKRKKFQLFIEFIFKIKHKENKLMMINYVLSFIGKEDIFLIEKLRKQIQMEKDKVLKNEMMEKLSEIK